MIRTADGESREFLDAVEPVAHRVGIDVEGVATRPSAGADRIAR